MATPDIQQEIINIGMIPIWFSLARGRTALVRSEIYA
jgi:hypothetical protein